MSRSPPFPNGDPPAIASSSRTSPIEDEHSDDGLEIAADELLAAEDPMHERMNDGYIHPYAGKGCAI